MANLRVVYDNVADKASSLAASTTAGSLAVSNLLTDIKTEVWRSTGTTATLTMAWNRAWPVRVVALAFTNFSPTATMQISIYRFATDSSPSYTSPAILCCPVDTGINNPVGFGGGVYADAWFEPGDVAEKVVISIVDSANVSGYLQAGRLIAGQYWSPERNAESDSVKLSMQDDSKHSRSESGSLWTDRGPMYKRLSFDLSHMSAADRNTMWRIVAGNGMSNSVYVSMMPDSTDAYEEQIHSVYGRLSSASAITYKYMHLHSTQLQIEEI